MIIRKKIPRVPAAFTAVTVVTLIAFFAGMDVSTTSISFDTGQELISIIKTQNYSFWNEEVKNDIYLPFHFLPGDKDKARSARLDAKGFPFLVSANSELVKTLLVSALKDKNLYSIGIAAHSFADSYAHQNFSGLNNEANHFEPFLSASENTGNNNFLKTLATSSLAPVGHLQALATPDEPNLVWKDPRLKDELRLIVNNERFAEAAKKIFRYFRIFLGKTYKDDILVIDKLKAIWTKQSKEERVSDYIIGWNLRPYDAQLWRKEAGAAMDKSKLANVLAYDKLAWLKSELLDNAAIIEQPIIKSSSAFYYTELYKWNEAAKRHQILAKSLIAKL